MNGYICGTGLSIPYSASAHLVVFSVVEWRCGMTRFYTFFPFAALRG